MLLLAEPSATPLDTLYDMNNLPPPNGPHSMGQDTSMPPSGGYTNEAWANLSPYNQSPYGNSPMTDYGFPNYVHHPLPSESLSRMPPPPPQPQYHHQMIQPAPSPHIPHQAQQSHAHMGHHQLPMLNTNTTWPSQLTNPSPSAGSYSAPPPTTTPVSSATTVDHPPVPIREEKQRRSLSIEQKRQMCQYHEENPGVKQAEIGAKFGVERSTVSKVLGKKDEYLQRDTETEPGPKRAKSKNHSLERTLVNFAKKQQARGLEIKDEELMEKARHFARINPDDKESLLSTLTPTWLRKFKKENRIGSGRLMRRASETNIPDSARREMAMARPAAGKGKSSRITSPVSAGGQMSPLSEGRSDEDMTTDAVDFDFSYSQPASHSTTSLTSDVRDTGRSSFSGTTMSPVGQFNFSPDPNTGAFQVDQNMHLHQDQQLDFHHREKRSNTFPSLNIDFRSQSVKADSSTPRIPPAMTAPSSAIDSPAGKELKPLLPANSLAMGMDPVLASSPTLRRQGSNPSLSARSNLASGSNSAVQSVDSSPVSPSQEDARQAARTLLNYMNSMNTQQGAFDQLELMTVMQLTKKLHLHQPMAATTMGPRGRGGLSRIPEGDGEGAAAEVTMETT